MHIQHLAVRLDGWCRTLLGVERLLEDGKGISGTPLFEIHVRIDDGGNVDEGTVYGVFVKRFPSQSCLAGIEDGKDKGLTLVFSPRPRCMSQCLTTPQGDRLVHEAQATRL